MTDSTFRLRGENLTLGYGKKIIVRDLSVSIPDGHFTAIIGPNGCGKSTLTHALEKAGLPTVSADALVAQLYAAGGEMADYLGRRFGERLLEDDGSEADTWVEELMAALTEAGADTGADRFLTD